MQEIKLDFEGKEDVTLIIPNEIIDISDEVTPKFFETFTKGQMLGYRKDGVITHYKIVRLDKKRKVVKVQETKLYTEKELNDKLTEKK